MEITKSTVYKRLFTTNILVTIFLITTLDFYFVNKFLENNKEVKSYINENFCWDSTIYDISSICCYNLGMFEESLENINKAIELNPDDDRLKENKKIIEKHKD